MAVRYISNLDSDGTVFGQSSADLIGFYGATPVARPSLTTWPAVSTSVPIAACAGFAFQTSAQMIALIDVVNRLRAVLVSLGLGTT